jgi:hypothetical protein
VPALAVVVGLDPVEGRLLQVLDVGPGAGVDEFLLVAGEEGFGDGVVVADSSAAQGWDRRMLLFRQ